VHLTFLDAYVPSFWKEGRLADVNTSADVNCWAEHYYTRDLTSHWTQRDLSHAHNVDLSSIDGVLRDHNFPWQWYYATISEQPARSKGEPASSAETDYGFLRSLEAGGPKTWHESLQLARGKAAVRLKRR
jgi:hypothetical protein